MLRFLADDDDELGLVLHLLAGVARDDHGLAMGDERVVGAIADVGLLGEIGRDAALLRLLEHMGAVIEPGAVEGARDHRHLDLDGSERVAPRRPLMAGEGIARDLGDLIALENAVGGAARRGVPDPAHGLSSRRAS